MIKEFVNVTLTKEQLEEVAKVESQKQFTEFLKQLVVMLAAKIDHKGQVRKLDDTQNAGKLHMMFGQSAANIYLQLDQTIDEVCGLRAPLFFLRPNLKRYMPDRDGDMNEFSEGEWTKYADVVNLLNGPRP